MTNEEVGAEDLLLPSPSSVMEAGDRHGRYSMVLEWEPEGGVYIVTVPELPGCRTHGRTHEEAVKHGREVIELWIDSVREDNGLIPPPRYFDLDSIDAATQNRLIMTGDDDEDALPYQERMVEIMLANVAEARRAIGEANGP